MMRMTRDIAIIGMAGIYPGAPDIGKFWSNILSKVDAVTTPPDNWEVEKYYDPLSSANDTTYCKHGGFIDEFAEFDPVEFGIMPASINGSDPEMFLALKVAREALHHAGYQHRPFDRKKTAVILGHATYMNRALGTAYQHAFIINQVLSVLQTVQPDLSQEDLQLIKKELKAGAPPFTPDTCPGLISNLLSSMIANRLDLQGPNFVIDAACASSLIALDLGISRLLSGECDMAIVGGVQAYTSLGVFIVFSLLGALSRRGKIRPFDKNADGTLLGSGLGMMVIKRLQDAQRDHDCIYAIIKGVGVASDGKAQAALVPRLEGEMLAIERAYQQTGIDPRSIGLIETHGTATRVGDATEIQALTNLFGTRKGDFPVCALGTVKSMISHTIPAAGMAGLIKTALALHHKILPPTLCDEPNPDLGIDKTPFYLNTETRPWIHVGSEPRRAGVSAFGFGGINAHAILEEYNGENTSTLKPLDYGWDSEVVIVQAAGRAGLMDRIKKLLDFIADRPETALKDIAYTLNRLDRELVCRLAVVAESLPDLTKKLRFAVQRLADQTCVEINDRSGVFYADEPLAAKGKLAFLFPGEGSQYVNMFSELCIHFPEVRQWFDRAEGVFTRRSINPSLAQVLFPPPFAEPELKKSAESALMSMEYAVMSVCAADLAMNDLLTRLGITPEVIAGHSIGQDIALLIAGIKEEGDEGGLFDSYYQRNAALYKATQEEIAQVKLMSVGLMSPEAVAALAAESNGELCIAMDNCPNQIVLCGPEPAVDGAYHHLVKKGAICIFLPFDRGYHTHWYRPLCERIAKEVACFEIKKPTVAIYSCTTAGLLPANADEIRRMMVDQWALPVRFRETVEKMYEDGVRLFVEAGPKGNLSGFVEDTLRGRQYLAVPADVSSKSSITQLNTMIGRLASHGVDMRLDYLYQKRLVRTLAIQGFITEESAQAVSEGSKATVTKRVPMKLELVVPPLRFRPEVRESLSASLGGAKGTSPQPESGDGQTLRSESSPPRAAGNVLRINWSSPFADLQVPQLCACLCMLRDRGKKASIPVEQILAGGEIGAWNCLRLPEPRRYEWLLAKMAAKDAVRCLMKDNYLINLDFKDIEIRSNQYGGPLLSGDFLKTVKRPLLVSMSHSDSISVAMAGFDVAGLGIDIEHISRDTDGLLAGGFIAAERLLLEAFEASTQKEWLLRLWCAKESAGKALGRGLMGSPLNLCVSAVDSNTGAVALRLCGQLARELPRYADREIIAQTGRDAALIFASTIIHD